jgi:hypothetical protein
MSTRRSVLKALVAAAFVPLAARAQARPELVVYKNRGCSCCGGWENHMQAAGFAVRSYTFEDISAIKRQAGVPEKLQSCHTALIAGYAIEGHVPAAEIRRLLAQKPRAAGLSVPGMPPGSPGMEGPAKVPYDVMLVGGDGKASVYRHY